MSHGAGADARGCCRLQAAQPVQAVAQVDVAQKISVATASKEPSGANMARVRAAAGGSGGAAGRLSYPRAAVAGWRR